MHKRYKELDQAEKIQSLSLTAEIISLKPEVLSNPQAFGELLDMLEKHAVELSDRFHGKPPQPITGAMRGAYSV